MKLRKTASGKQTIKMSRKEWLGIGKMAKWIDKSTLNKKAFDEDEWGDISQFEDMGEAPKLFDVNPEEKRNRLIDMIKAGDLTEEQVDRILEEEGITFDDIEAEDEASALAAQEDIASELAAEEAEDAAREQAEMAVEDEQFAADEKRRMEDAERIEKLRGQAPIA